MSDIKEQIGLSLGRIPSGLFIVTFHNNELNEPDGMLMSWIQQCSFDPPMISVAIKKDRKGLELIKESKYFVVNVMGKENAKMIGSFYKGVGKAKFEGIDTSETENKIQYLSEAVSYLECEFQSSADTTGDHVQIFGKVLGGNLLNSAQNEPSIHLRKNGYDY
ncbi:MAG: flavin reductase family protein [Candidatus Caenarcaniphilales bacterium]|nr:flavin reductase family protein [Candidatus Caenarcaniphilales bacterium]